MFSTNSVRFDYSAADYEPVACNICGANEVESFATCDRNSLRVRSVICRNCGLMFISPRMTPEWYGKYYDVEYRRQMAEFKGRAVKVEDDDQRFAKQAKRGAWLAKYLREHGISAPRRILDIGSSNGGLLAALRDEFGAVVRGVEPSPSEAAYAESRGVPTAVGLFEEYRNGDEEPFDLVLCSQAFNHLLDPRAVAEKVRQCLQPDGAFFVECQDFFHMCRLHAAIYESTQIDHVYMFVPATLQSLLGIAGFAVDSKSVLCDRFQSVEALVEQRRQGVPSTHMRMIARPAAPATAPTSKYAEVHTELRTMPDSPIKAWLKQRRRVLLRMRYGMSDRIRERVTSLFNRQSYTEPSSSVGARQG